ncbi:MAG: hypothetical protein H0V81_17650 [Solirubrobacterales bacterium]|nr:hypothetical protein [Solirubrobacterales bacterium]
MLVERDALRIAEALNEYDESLVVLCVDPDHVEGISEEPFVVAEKCKDGILRPVLRAWKLDESILTRIHLADGQRHNTLKILEGMEADTKKENDQRYQEKREESKDIVLHIAGMKSKYTVRDSQTDELITFYDDRPSTRTA